MSAGSRPWEKLSQAVLSLLALSSLDAYWEIHPSGEYMCWCIARQHNPHDKIYIRMTSTLEEWIEAVERFQ